MNNVFNDTYYHKLDHFRFDTVDITRAALTQLFDYGTADIMKSCNTYGKIPLACGIFDTNCAVNQLRLIAGLEDVLSCDTHFMLGAEEAQAMNSSNGTLEDRDLLRFNVRNQRTMWGPEAEINDYAARHYAGLMEYYHARWQFFFTYAAENGCKHEDMENYNNEIMISIEQQFYNLEKFPLFKREQTDNYAPIMQTIFQIYDPLINNLK